VPRPRLRAYRSIRTYETLAICRSLALARAAFDAAIAEKPAARF
jgi:hypothetical protein